MGWIKTKTISRHCPFKKGTGKVFYYLMSLDSQKWKASACKKKHIGKD
jgi:hypothetical protein